MTSESQSNEITRKPVVYTHPGMEEVAVRRDIEYAPSEAGSLTFDLYSPPNSSGDAPRPAVVLVTGYPDPGYEAVLGCKQKEVAAYVSWARLIAASGLVAVTYVNDEPQRDLEALLRHLRREAATLGIDENRMGVWACSGNVPMALAALARDGGELLACAALCYGFMLDLGDSTAVAEAAAQFRFVDPGTVTSLEPLRRIPMLLVRAGRDAMPRLNESIDLFVAEALAQNLPLTLVNHASAPHAFDIVDDSERSQDVVRQVLAFLRAELKTEKGSA